MLMANDYTLGLPLRSTFLRSNQARSLLGFVSDFHLHPLPRALDLRPEPGND